MASPIVRVEVPFAARPLQRLQMTGVVDLAHHQLSVGLRPFGGAPVPLQPPAPVTHALRFSRQAQFLSIGLHNATIRVIGDPGNRSLRPAEPMPFSIVLSATGGLLAMSPPELPQTDTPIRCETIERERAAPGAEATAAVVFRPAAAIVDDPSAREAYALTTSAPDAPVAETTFRLSGGAEDKTDVSTRISIGRSPTNGSKDWVPRVRMDGGRRLDILATEASDPALEVQGTVYLPPIGKDDPLLPNMMAMAFMAGLRQAGKIAATSPAFTISAPATIQRGATLTYSVTNIPANIRRIVEFVAGIKGSHDLTFRSIPIPLTNTVDIATFTHTASQVELQVVLLTATGNTSPKLVIAPPVLIDVTS
jgi:hypothetical protein